MSIRPLGLDGWENLSTWGYDDGMASYYAQLTRNDSSDDNGPDIWISPGRGRWPAVDSADRLAELIADATSTPLATVRTAMNLNS